MHLPAVLDNPALHQVLAAVITFLGVYVLLTTTDRVLTAQRRRQLAASRGCEPVRLRPSKDRFGIAMSREILQSDKEHRLPTFIHEVFGEMGAWTWGYKSVRRTATITADPILIHVLLSKQFDGTYILHPPEVVGYKVSMQRILKKARQILSWACIGMPLGIRCRAIMCSRWMGARGNITVRC